MNWVKGKLKKLKRKHDAKESRPATPVKPPSVDSSPPAPLPERASVLNTLPAPSTPGPSTTNLPERAYASGISSAPLSPGLPAPLPERVSDSDISSELSIHEALWNRAYDELKSSEKAIVDAYEKILSYELRRSKSEELDLASQTNDIAQTPSERWHQMNQLIQAGLERIENEAAIKKKISDGMQTIQSIQSLVSSAVESCPQAAIAWAGVCLALQILSGPFSESAANRQGISYVLTRMDWYWKLSNLLLDKNRAHKASEGLRKELEKHIVDLYKKLLLFEMKSVCLYYRNRVKVFLRDLVHLDQWDASLTEIQAAEDDIRKDSEQYNTQEIRSSLQNLYATAKTQEAKLQDIHTAILQQTAQHGRAVQSVEDKKCLEDLRVTNPADDKQRIQTEKGGLLKDSYKWILGNPDFCHWRTDPNCRILWINGDPGKGKTMLLCGIIDELTPLKADPSEPLLSFFFCQATDKRINNATAILRGLVYHLAKQRPSLLSHVREEYDRSGEKMFQDANNWFAMCRVFQNILNDSAMKNACIIVDALDECITDLDKFFVLLSQSQAHSHVKWILSSRNWVTIEDELISDKLPGLQCLKLDEIPMADAVEAYVLDQVDKLARKKKYKPETRLAVQAYLISHANGTFLWVALVCQELAKRKLHSMKTLESFPPGLNALYKRMLDGIDEYDADLCNQILALSAIVLRPLEKAELAALVEQLGELDDTIDDTRLDISIKLCGSFLALRGSTVSFIHQSAKDFLLNDARDRIFPSGLEFAHKETFSRSLKLLHRVLKRDIYGLRAPGFPIKKVITPNPDPLGAVRYSCVYWVDHLCECSKTGTENSDLQDGGAIDTFFSEKYLYWLEALSLIGAMSRGMAAMRQLEDLERGMGKKVARLVQDTRRHIIYYKWVIENTPLQVYASALIFSPTQSEVRKLYAHEEPRWITTKPIMSESWSKCPQTVMGVDDFITSVAISPDGKFIASNSGKTVKVWDTTLAECIRTFEGHSLRVYSVAFSQTGRQIASGSFDRTVRIWDLSSGQCTRTLSGHLTSVFSVTCSLKSPLLASRSHDSTIRIWNIESGDCIKIIHGHSGMLSVAFSPDGTKIASGFKGGSINLWNVASGSNLITLGHTGYIFAVEFSPNGKLLASGSSDKTVKLWNTASWTCERILQHTEIVTYISLSANGLLASSTGDLTNLTIWETSSGKILQTIRDDNIEIYSIAFAPSGKTLAIASDDGTIKLWDTSAALLAQDGDDYEGEVYCVAFSPNGLHFLSLSRHQGETDKLRVFTSGILAYTLDCKSFAQAKFSPDSQQLAFTVHDHVQILDLSLGNIVHTFESDTHYKVCIAFSPDSKHLAIGTEGRVNLYDLVNSTCRHIPQEKHSSLYSLEFSQDGEKLAIYSDYGAEIWSTCTGNLILETETMYKWWRSSAMSPDGKLLAYHGPAKIMVRDVMSGECIHTLNFHEDFVSIIFSSDGKQLILKTEEKSQIWDMASDKCISTLTPEKIEAEEDETIIAFKDGILLTSYGGYTIPTRPLDSKNIRRLEFEPVGYGVDPHYSWITLDGQDVLWLPPEYRPNSYWNVTVQGRMIGIGCGSGKILMIGFSEHPDCT